MVIKAGNSGGDSNWRAAWAGSRGDQGFTLRMETPVIYFYPVKSMKVSVNANFPAGLGPYAHYAVFVHDQAAGTSSSGLCCDLWPGLSRAVTTESGFG